REVRAMIGLISHQTFLYDDLSALENLVFFGRLHGVDRVEERAEALLVSFDLAARADDRVRTFSRGMQQRLSVARALVHEPAIVFLDEPFPGLAPAASLVLERTLTQLRREGRTLLVTTHDLARGIALADRYVILARGRIVGAGATAGVDPARFEPAYLAAVAG